LIALVALSGKYDRRPDISAELPGFADNNRIYRRVHDVVTLVAGESDEGLKPAITVVTTAVRRRSFWPMSQILLCGYISASTSADSTRTAV